MRFNTAQQRALSIAPHVTGVASMVGSGCIIKSIVTETRTRNNGVSTYQRLLLGMSCMDFVTSCAFALSTWPIPKGTPGVWQPLGNDATCAAQGFFTAMIVGVPLYNLQIALYPVMVAIFDWKEEHFRAVEPYMHAIPLLFSLGVSIASLALKLFNNANLWCWIAPFPLGCKDSFRYGEEANCVRGDNAWVYRFAFGYGPIWFCIGAAMICMLIVYWKVLQRERDVDKFQHDGTVIRKQSKRVAWQAVWYVLAFYITWVPATVTRVLQVIPSTKGEMIFPVIFLMATFVPSQGFLNFTVFFRAKYLKYRRDHPGCPIIKALGSAAFHQATVHIDEPMRESLSDQLPEMPLSLLSKSAENSNGN